MGTAKPSTSVDTKRSIDRRAIRFETSEDLRRDLCALEAAGLAGTLRTSGNWTPAQIYNHLAAFVEFATDGYPHDFKPPPAPVRLVMRFFKNKYLHRAMPAGLHIPGIRAGTIGQDDGPPGTAIARLRAALDKLDRTAPRHPNHLFGRMTHQDWVRLNLRHCELHLSFLHPR